ncbi:MAG: hypothetical protein E7254_04015 [Lachnospiraceae bacterium]|nr:hypothetical protein [Lachnospiraceae bacterium]
MTKMNLFKRVTSIVVSTAMISTLAFPNINVKMFSKDAEAATVTSLGSIGNGACGLSDTANLPTFDKQGNYRFTTSNYDSNHQALDTTDWATNWLWDHDGAASRTNNELSGTAYALPLTYLAKRDGLRVAKPSMTSAGNNVCAYMNYTDDAFCDWKINPAWTLSNMNIDNSTDWSYDAVTTNPNNANQSMKITMTQGSPFTYISLNNSNEITFTKLRTTFSSEVVFDEVYNGCKLVVFRTMDTTNLVHYPNATFQYYALYLPQSTTETNLGTNDNTGNDKIGSRKFTLPSGKTYLSFAWITEGKDIDNNNAINIAKQYRPYAFNFITDTKATYTVSNGNVIDTTYTYSFDKKAESTADGTVMGVLSHQYRYMSGYNFLSNKAFTIRGYMKFLIGSSYKTVMKYKGILPSMPAIADSDSTGKAELQQYVDEFTNQLASGDTYWLGKQLNRSAQAINAAKAVGDDEKAQQILEGLEKKLEDWFTYSGENDKSFFTYFGNGVGSLLGSNMTYNGIDQLNDHHFHYGYYIDAAATIGLYDPDWLASYADVVKQLIFDIASPYRTSADSINACGNAYPYLRCFSPYEGHSWASGFQDEKDGNNQESTSEAINAWAGIILFGELTNDSTLKNLGKYLYTTEIAAADDYWFDIEKDTYKIEGSKYQAPMAGMVWGGKADYATYFGIEYTQAIQIFPMQPWSFYLLDGGANYVKDYYDYNYASDDHGSIYKWNDIWAEYYAFYDPNAAMNTVWTHQSADSGESPAHTYHFIRTFQNYGTPDVSFTSNTPMSAVFKKGNVYTYVVYNAGNNVSNVVFNSTNGTIATVKAAPKSMTVVNSNDLNKSPYKIEYYGKNKGSSTYSLISSEFKYADAGTTVTAPVKNITGFDFETNNSSNVKSASVASNGTTVLKLYYNRKSYSISYELNGGSKSDTSLYPTSYSYGDTFTFDVPVKDGYDFYGWYKDADYSVKLNALKTTTHGDITLYAKWIPSGTIMVTDDIYLSFDKAGVGTFKYFGETEKDACNVLYRIYDTEEAAKAAVKANAEEGFTAHGLHKTTYGYSNTVDYSGSIGKYIVFYFIRYQNGAGSPKSLYGCGKIVKGSVDIPVDYETVTTVITGPIEVFGENIRSEADNTITVVWGNSEGHKYNVYVDGNIVLNDVYCGEYTLRQIPAGQHTVKITSLYDGKESNGVSKVVTVGGSTTIETSTPGETGVTGDQPIEVFGLDVKSEKAGVISVIWGQSSETIALGQTYNIYIDGSKVKSEIGCGLYTFNVQGGNHTVKVTATYNGKETAGASANVNVEQAAETQAPEISEGAELLKNTQFNGASNWNEYSENNASFTNNNNGSLTVNVPKYTSGTNYATQLRQDGFQLVAGKWYRASATITSSVDKRFQLIIQNNVNWGVYGTDYITVNANKTETITLWFQANESTTDTLFGIMLGYVDGVASDAATVTIKNVSLKAYDNKVDETETESETVYEPAHDDYGNIISSDIEISGFQINTSFGGHRVLYSMEDTVEGKSVSEFGLVYGLDYDTFRESDMKVGSTNKYVKSFAGTETNGRLSSAQNNFAKSYAMTMSFAVASKVEFEDTYYVRAYAKLSDGTYVYSNIRSYRILDVANSLYYNNSMPSVAGHNYLYNNIIKVCDPNADIKPY